ncbi:MAG: sigma-54 dependent transcriptional regulator [Spirochaetales bacterium]|nr:sigma-54 dependent transcriptional regulator [Spirochaetales bacterium]
MEHYENILLIDDEDGLRFGLKTYLTKQGYQVFDGRDRKDALAYVNAYPIHIAVLDIRLENEERGLDLIDLLRERNPDVIILMVTGYAQLETAVEAIRKGANDYLEKPLENDRILDSIRKNIEIFNLRKENRLLRNELKNINPFQRIVASSQSMKDIVQMADKVKNLAPNILITGESGTGKEVLARYIHYTGLRKENLFVGLNSAALSDSLLLSELFGHRKGAFTGAVENKTGKLELAHNGTFFLDEIGDMNMDIQAKFLRVLEERSFEPLGGNESVNVDVHVIAATNKDLEQLIREGLFREDLLYRLKVINFHLPPLRERVEDIQGLADNFILNFNRQYGKRINKLSPPVLEILKMHIWPGNIRELRNVINQAVILTDGNDIDLEIISNLLGNRKIRNIDSPGNPSESIPPILETGSLSERIAPVVQYYEKKLIMETLSRNNNNKSRTAEELGITRKTIGRKLQSFEDSP